MISPDAGPPALGATTRRRVLVIAEAANPEWVSVPLVGWSMASALRAVADVHIVTQCRNREAFLRAGLVEGVDFTSIDSERVASRAYAVASILRGNSGKGWTLNTAVQALTYPYFERLVWRQFGAALKARQFDIVHRLTPLSPTAQSPIARKCRKAGVPFILGPLNGGLPWPREFDQERRREREWLSYVRNVYKLLPHRLATFASARAILAGSRHTATEIPEKFSEKLFYMPENGIDPSRFHRIAAGRQSGPLRLCFIGRLVPYKGLDMALHAAMPLLKDGKAHFDVVGEGPERIAMEAFVQAHGIQNQVRFHGWVDHRQVQEIASEAEIFLFPSIREFGGGAVLEAMAIGLVPIVVDHGGPGELVCEDRGIAVPLGSRKQIVAELQRQLDILLLDRGRVHAMGLRAREWALEKLTWHAKAEAMADIYEWALGKAAAKPEPY